MRYTHLGWWSLGTRLGILRPLFAFVSHLLLYPLNKVYSPLNEVPIETLSIIRKIGNNVDLETQEIMPGSHFWFYLNLLSPHTNISKSWLYPPWIGLCGFQPAKMHTVSEVLAYLRREALIETLSLDARSRLCHETTSHDIPGLSIFQMNAMSTWHSKPNSGQTPPNISLSTVITSLVEHIAL